MTMAVLQSELACRAFNGIAEMKRAASIAELDDAAADLFDRLGLPWFALARFFRPDRASDTEVLLGRFEPGWAARYVAKGYGRSSQIAREMIFSPAPYAWSDVIRRRGLNRVQERIWNEARDFGLSDGLFTPVRWKDGSYAAVVLGGRQADLADPLLRTMAEVLSSYYASEGRRLLAPAEESRPVLSPRQRECLAWVRQGKSSAAIAGILGLSAETVEEHIGEACRKLGVRTRVQAVVEACLLGLIDH
jgi:DNA-binding CsgD family transcriptional regulator